MCLLIGRGELGKTILVNSLYEYEIDGTESYDRDSKFGGTVNYYRLIIGNDTIFQALPIFRYYFPSEGTFTIEIDVLDNDSLQYQKRD